MSNSDEQKNNKDGKKYERLIRNINSTANSIAMYPAGHPIVEKQLKNLYQEIIEILKTENFISLHQGEGVLVVNDAQLPTNLSGIGKIIQRFNDFKITDLEINKGLREDELRSFLDIFSHSEESVKIYTDLNNACQKNGIVNIKSLQAAYIRVPKGVKDKLGGKTVGELKISQQEMERLISYLKGEINLTDPKELSVYQKVFKTPNLLVSLIDKIVVESQNQSPEKRKKLVIVVLNQIGNYLSRQSSSANKQKESIKIISALQKALATDSQTVLALGRDGGLKNEIKQTVEKIISLVKNQTLIAEYKKHRDQLLKVKGKIEKTAPQLLTFTEEGQSVKPAFAQSELKKLLKEIKNFLEKIGKTKNLTAVDVEIIKSILVQLKKFF